MLRQRGYSLQNSKQTQNQLDNSQINYINQQKNLNFIKYLSLEESLEDKLKKKQEIKKRKFNQLLREVTFYDADLSYPHTRKYIYQFEVNIMPFCYFYKLLAKRPEGSDEQQRSIAGRLKLWIPDTIVIYDEDLPPMWFYSSKDGYVYRSDLFNYSNVVEKFTLNSQNDDLVAVFKKPYYQTTEVSGNDVNLVTSFDMLRTTQAVFSAKGNLAVIQNFIKSCGQKPYICRTCWRKGKSSYSWIITQKQNFDSEEEVPAERKYITTPRIMGTTNIVKTHKGKFVKETEPYILNILRYLKIHLKITFKEFVADFIKDEQGIWWFINVKAFILDEFQAPINIKIITMDMKPEAPRPDQIDNDVNRSYSYQNIKACKFCDIVYPLTELQYQLTLKQIQQNDKHLQNRSVNLNWINRIQPKHLDTAQLYTKYYVCNVCFKLNQQIEQLINYEYKLAQILGVPVPITAMNFVSFVDLKGKYDNVSQQSQINRFHNNPQDLAMPESWNLTLQENTELIILPNQPIGVDQKPKNILKKLRMIILLNDMKEIPHNHDQLQQYYIEYKIFNMAVRYKLDFDQLQQKNDQNYNLTLNFARIFYFFCEDRNSIKKFLEEMKTLSIYLYKDNDKIGVIEAEISAFQSEIVLKQEYYKFFSGIDLQTLKWGLTMTIGMVEDGQCNVKRIKLQECNGLFLPPSNYYTSDPLPQEWMIVIQAKQDFDKKNFSFTRRSSNQSQKKNRSLSITNQIINFQPINSDPYNTPYQKYQKNTENSYKTYKSNNIARPSPAILSDLSPFVQEKQDFNTKSNTNQSNISNINQSKIFNINQSKISNINQSNISNIDENIEKDEFQNQASIIDEFSMINKILQKDIEVYSCGNRAKPRSSRFFVKKKVYY